MCVVQGILDLEYMLDNLKNLWIIAFHYLTEYFPHTAIWNLAFWFFQQTHRQIDIPTALSQLIYYLSFIIYLHEQHQLNEVESELLFLFHIPCSSNLSFYQLLLRLLSFFHFMVIAAIGKCYFKWCICLILSNTSSSACVQQVLLF